MGSGGDVFADHGKVTGFHFEDVGASVTARAGAESVSNGGIEKAADEHSWETISLLICVVNSKFAYRFAVATRNRRTVVCLEVVRLLAAERKRQGISMNALAAKSGLSQSFISMFESQPANPTLDTLIRISDALGLDPGDVLKSALNNAAGEEPGPTGRGGDR